jgi:Rhodopirellula transposase DDE domain
VKVGAFSRRGRSRVEVEAADHDFKPDDVVIPYGILQPKSGQLSLYFSRSPITADFIVDRISQWWQTQRLRFPLVKTLVINQDNGPENQSRRTQFLKRIVSFVAEQHINVRLAYYPPYHSKYNPIERCWGILEQHWNGCLLLDIETVLGFAQSMTWRGHAPTVQLIDTIYLTGIRLTQDAMAVVESCVHRLEGLQRWFVDILYPDAVSLNTILLE